MTKAKFEREIFTYEDSNELLLVLNVANYYQIGCIEERKNAISYIDHVYNAVVQLLGKYIKKGVVTAVNGFDTVGEIDAYIKLVDHVSPQQIAGVKRAISNLIKKF